MLALAIAVLASIATSEQPAIRLENRNGTDWLVMPNGRRFWSFAVDCVGTGGKGKPDNPAYDAHDLFPSDAAWTKDTVSKLQSWGFNSLGGWCDTNLFRKYRPAKSRLPYIEVLHLGAYAKAPWDDLFDPKNIGLMRAAAEKLIPPLCDDPFLIGYCTDNELGWWDDTLFLSYFKFPASAPGKQALIASMRLHYKDSFQKLKEEWNTRCSDFKSLASATTISLKPGRHGITAVHDFNTVLTTHYYALVHHLVREFDKAHLILGDRYCQYYNLETAEASKPYVDVESSNDGADWIDGSYTHFQLETLHRLTGRPILITEYYFAAREGQSGNRNTGEGFPTVQTQAERAKGFSACTHFFAAQPYVVGAHWFQFYDEPPKGRGDGEDFNMGLVDVYGKPYKDMIAAAQAAHVERVHSEHVASVMQGIPAAPHAPMKDALLHWDRSRAYIPSASREQWADLYATYDRSTLYVGLVAMEFIDESLWENDKMPTSDMPCLTVQLGSWHATILFNAKGTPARCSDPRVSIAEKPGLKRTLILQIPASILNDKSLKIGQTVALHAQLSSHGHGYRMAWNQSLSLN